MSLLGALYRKGYKALYRQSALYEEEVSCRRSSPTVGFRIDIGNRDIPTPVDSLTPQETIDLYTFLRRREAGNSGPPVDATRRRSYEIYRSQGLSSLQGEIAEYINDAYKDYVYPDTYNLITTEVGLDTSVSPVILDTSVNDFNDDVDGTFDY